MGKQNCEKCRFFDQYPHAHERTYDGSCLRYPPQLSEKTVTPWCFPEVHKNDCCGEWRPTLGNGNISAYHEE